MGKTFVYNAGSPEAPSPGILQLTFGLFFDGTKNNRTNTEIRKKVQHKGEFKNVAATAEEKRIYDKYYDKDNSFGNDFTNVARMYMNTDRVNYSIYIEGIGTVDRADDVGAGYKYGRGETGIVGKVKKGCASLAQKVAEAYKNDKKIKTIILTIDVFGFSRGAAAARNFLYNVQMPAYKPVPYYPPQSPLSIPVDHDGADDGSFVQPLWLNGAGLLPKHGHLGTALLAAGVSREMTDNMVINVRFAGFYDTVASYDPTCLLLPSFKKNIERLHLHEIGAPQKAVHFTAADEHRKNFSLTRFSAVELRSGIERNLPGVHSDVGGSYNQDDPFESEHIEFEVSPMSAPLNAYRTQLIEQGWYWEREITLEHRGSIFLGNSRYLLSGTRNIFRGYTFIPLHFMSDYAKPYLNEEGEDKILKYANLMNAYALRDPFIKIVKEYIKEHIIEKGENWVLKNDADADKNLRQLRYLYLHQSAKINTFSDEFANASNSDYKRQEF